MKKKILIYGPYFTNYSYAIVNRNIARAMSAMDKYSVKVGCRAEDIDYYPTKKEVELRLELKGLVDFDLVEADVLIYNNFPKSTINPLGLKNLPGKLKLVVVAWEDSIYPKDWTEEINQYASGVIAISTFVKNVLINSGVNIPITVAGLGIEEEFLDSNKNEEYELKDAKQVKFLHISTAKERKGVDLLIKAFAEEFDSNDDVTLVLKSSPGPDNNIVELIQKNQKENFPQIIYINDSSLTIAQIASLYRQSDCGVYPSRAEGFGLPALESMYFKKPVIVTGYSGYMDFCDGDNSYLLPYKLVNAVSSLVINIGAKWAEPSIDKLKQYMREVYTLIRNKDTALLEKKAELGFKSALNFTWKNCAEIITSFVDELQDTNLLKEKKIAVISALNDQTGISVYTKSIFEGIEGNFKEFYYIAQKNIADRTAPDTANVVRLWTLENAEIKDILDFVKEKEIQILHIQYHTGCTFGLEELDLLIKKLSENQIEVFITFHHIRSSNIDFLKTLKNLNCCSKIFIHNPKDFEYAAVLLNNAFFLRHYGFEFSKREISDLKKEMGVENYYPIITTHGLLNVNKNVDKLIDQFEKIKVKFPKAILLSLTAVSPNNIFAEGIYSELVKQIKEKKLEASVFLIKEFLDSRIIELYFQLSDLIVFLYSEFGESASGAVRRGIAAFKPVITTDIPTFAEFEKEILKIKDFSDLPLAVEKILIEKNAADLINAEKEFVKRYNATKIGCTILREYIKS